MTEKTMNEKIATGQAYNLAVHDAIAGGNHIYTTYILERFIYYYDLGVLLQAMDLDDVRLAVKGGKKDGTL